MKHEKIIRRGDGSKVRIIVELRVELFRDSHSWEFSVDLCQKGKRTWLSSCDSESSKRESEERALEALIVSQIWQERDPDKVDDLPELSIEERAAMDSIGTDLVQRLWKNLPDEDNE